MQSILDLKTSANPRRITLGMHGTGLPLIEKNDIATITVNTSDKVVIVNTRGELNLFVSKIGGVVVNVSDILGYANEIIFERFGYDEERYDSTIFEFFESLGNLLSKDGLTPMQKSILSKCISIVVKEKEKCNIKAFLSILKELDEELAILYGILDSEYFSCKKERAYSSIENRIVSFVLNSSSYFSAIEFLFVLKIVENKEHKLHENGFHRLWFFSKIDENIGLEKESYYFSTFYKVSRMYGTIAMLYSNEFEIFTKGEYFSSILNCTEDFVIGKQSKYDVDLLCKYIPLLEEQEELKEIVLNKDKKEIVWTNGIEYEVAEESFLQSTTELFML